MLVSIIICSYNSAKTLEKALTSAVNQTFTCKEYEVLVINDGSNDHTADVVHSSQKWHPNLRYIQFPSNRGLPAASNYGILNCLGKYYIRLDADDEFHEDILSLCVEPLEGGITDLVYSDRYEVDRVSGKRKLVAVDPFSLFDLVAAGTMMRADLLRKLGGYRPFFWEEYDLYLRYLELSGKPPVRVPHPLYTYHRHPSSMTSDESKVSNGWRQLRDEWGDQVLQSYGWPGPKQEVTQ